MDCGVFGQVPQDRNGFLVRCRQSTYRMSAMFGVLYRSGAFLTEDECSYIAQQGLEFLSCYAGMALEHYRSNKQWMFPLYPKFHTFHHIMLETKWSRLRVGTSCNPMIFSCEQRFLVGRFSLYKVCLVKCWRRHVACARRLFVGISRMLVMVFSA